MLYPIRNSYRQYIDLSGFWDFRFDFKEEGIESEWYKGYSNGKPIAVPASWNDQFAENRDFLGPGWYQTYFDIPKGWDDQKIIIRFGSVNYLADVWLNGENIGSHEGGHLPFEFDVTNLLNPQNNLLVVRVDGTLAPDRVPPSGRPQIFPNTNFDFFPFCGIHRPVLLYSVPKKGLEDITIITNIENNSGIVSIKLKIGNEQPVESRILLNGEKQEVIIKKSNNENIIEKKLIIKNPELWSTNNPYLYDLTAEILKNGTVIDAYTLRIGIRTIQVKGNELFLNDKPVRLYGFGRHEDFPVTGRGYLPAVIIKDYSLMKWIGANSFRTTHYPYSEQMMDLADSLGFLIIDEIPAVGLTFDSSHIDRHLKLCKQYMQELYERDKNHPSVIMWSLANEPRSSKLSKNFFLELYQFIKEIDSSRLITLINSQNVRNDSFEFFDMVCLNRYYGWYVNQGQIQKGIENLSEELENLYIKYKKPIFISEFGTDTIPGWHSQPPEMFSEEYQIEFLKKYIELIESKPFIIGYHVWNLCDFKTSQGVLRMGGINFKGVFTRDRRPKMAAHFLKKLWIKKEDI
ncbi:MAG: beta-glucuronidase [Promethearchaeota archaeon]